MVWSTYPLALTYVYNLQLHKSIEVYPFSLTLTRTTPRPTSITKRGTNLATNDEMSSPMYSKLERIKRFTDLCQEAHKNLRLAQGLYKNECTRGIRFVPIFQVRDHVLVDRPFFFRSTPERSVSGW